MTHVDRLHRCLKCNLAFKTHKEYITHNRQSTHSYVRKVVCSICGLEVNNTTLKGHITRIHGGGPPIKCYLCDTNSNNVYSLRKTHFESAQSQTQTFIRVVQNV